MTHERNRTEKAKNNYTKGKANPKYRNDDAAVCADVIGSNVCVVYVK